MPERLRHVPHRHAWAKRVDIGDLCRVFATVTLVDILDDLLAPVGLDVDVDVRWAVPFGCQEPFEQQLVAHRVDRGDAERVTHRGIGRGPSALTEDVRFSAEVDDVVDDQEISGKVQIGDDLQFLVDLLVRVGSCLRRSVPVRRTGERELPQMGVLVVSGRDVVGRQLRGDQVQVERALPADRGRSRHCRRVTGEQRRHLGAGPQVGTWTRRQERVGLVQAAPAADGRHCRGNAARSGIGVMRAGGGDHRQPQFLREVGERVVVLVIGGQELCTELDDDIGRAETVHQLTDLGPRGDRAVPGQCAPDPPFAAAGEDQPVILGGLREDVEVVDRPALLAAVQLRAADLGGQPVVALLTSCQHQQVIPDRVGDTHLRLRETERQLGAVERAQGGVRCGLGEPDDAVEAVMVGDGQRVQSQPERLRDQQFRGGGAVEEAEGRVAMQFGVGHPGGQVHRGGGFHRRPLPALRAGVLDRRPIRVGFGPVMAEGTQRSDRASARSGWTT